MKSVSSKEINMNSKTKKTLSTFEREMKNPRFKKAYEKSYKEWLIKSLKNKKEAAAFLQVALEAYQNDGDSEAFLMALRYVAEAQGGVGKLSKKTHLNRESLHKALSKKGNPKLQTIGVLLKGLGFEFFIKAL